MTLLLDGKALSQEIRRQLANEIKESNLSPGLAVVLVGEDPASQIYVRNKEKGCHEIGIQSFSHHLPATTSEDDLLSLIHTLNADEGVHGILVQLPLPKHISETTILEAISFKKDVDGFHPVNVGHLVSGRPSLRPCTPLGIMALIDKSGMELNGQQAVVVGRSHIVGKPIAIMLLERHATVTICHSRTKNLPELVKSADLVIAAIGRAEMIKGDWIKSGAVVIDVGINRTTEGKVVGDVEFESAKKVAHAITPVPGGVGPMTIAMLLGNTVKAAKKIFK